ncbi:MAG: efflux RND transporter periplasmic adaptor subunit [Fidelibacterota bacterium]|nr:MAG: efflux RND transporter periplasmic adaptor subunit [Candidatus Neomarinimicrobiota bacterium]
MIPLKIKQYFNHSMKWLKALPYQVWLLVTAAFLLGLVITAIGREPHEHDLVPVTDTTTGEVEWWTCSMHPQIKLPEPGQCPVCYMDLIPHETLGSDVGPQQLKMSESAMALAEIVTDHVRRAIAQREVRLSGKVAHDESRLGNITAWVPGRLERLYVDYTGISVQKGDHMVELYSPDLYAAQEELIQALKRVSPESQNQIIGGAAALATLKAAREKLRLLGLTDIQIREIEQRGTPSDRMMIYSPTSGVVIHKNAVEGMYVNTGSKIYTIADLDRVWVILDAYESDLSWIHYGQEVDFTVEALPGKQFHGRIAFIDPVLDEKTRTVKVRLSMANPDDSLKPGMFVRAVVQAVMDSRGRVINPDMAGKWVSPMHPEVVKDHPGKCDVCGMDLVRAEELGVVNVPSDKELPLVIPSSAVLLTGKRAVVYVKKQGADEPLFESREVRLGARAGDTYIVLEGLDEGEEVVVHGNFKIDSAMQIAAKPSMMNPEGAANTTGHEHHQMEGAGGRIPPTGTASQQGFDAEQMDIDPEFLDHLQPIYDFYFQAQAALADDDQHRAIDAIVSLRQRVATFSTTEFALTVHAADRWQEYSNQLVQGTEHAHHWDSIDAVRRGFEQVSNTIIALEQSFGHIAPGDVYQLFCPMAFNNAGAYWLQKVKQVDNPYFGAKMLRCGEVKAVMHSRPASQGNMEEHKHNG